VANRAIFRSDLANASNLRSLRLKTRPPDDETPTRSKQRRHPDGDPFRK
jgi:hypothetical protein